MKTEIEYKCPQCESTFYRVDTADRSEPKKNILSDYLVAGIVLAMFIGAFMIIRSKVKDRVEQHVDNEHVDALCPSGTWLTTLVWYDQQIVKGWYDDMPNVTDSLVKKRQADGQRLIKRLDLIK